MPKKKGVAFYNYLGLSCMFLDIKMPYYHPAERPWSRRSTLLRRSHPARWDFICLKKKKKQTAANNRRIWEECRPHGRPAWLSSVSRLTSMLGSGSAVSWRDSNCHEKPECKWSPIRWKPPAHVSSHDVCASLPDKLFVSVCVCVRVFVFVRTS